MATVNEMIINALSDIAPTYPWAICEEDGDMRDLRRIVFNYSVVPEGFSDDLPVYDRYLIQVHYFCPIRDDTVSVRRSIKSALQAAGFPRPTEITVGTGLQQAEREQHYCFETEYLESIEEADDGDA